MLHIMCIYTHAYTYTCHTFLMFPYDASSRVPRHADGSHEQARCVCTSAVLLQRARKDAIHSIYQIERGMILPVDVSL